MSAIAEASLPVSINRRRRVRQKVHAPAYASFGGASNSGMIDLYEVLDISEVGVALQCSSPMKAGQQLDLSLDLAEAGGPIYTPARVVWSDETGRVGLSLPALGNSALHRLQEWLFLNAMASAANAASSGTLPSSVSQSDAPRPNYTDTLTAASAVQREAESLRLRSRSSSFPRRFPIAIPASGFRRRHCSRGQGPRHHDLPRQRRPQRSACGRDACRWVRVFPANACAPEKYCAAMIPKPTTAWIRRVAAPSAFAPCSPLPLRLGERVVGLLEVFSAQPSAFGENDSAVLQRFAETIVAAVNRAVRVHQPAPVPASPISAPRQHSVRSRARTERGKKRWFRQNASADADKVGGIRLPRAHLYFLVVVAAIIFLVLGYTLAPWIQEKLQGRGQIGEQTVLASTHAPAGQRHSANPGHRNRTPRPTPPVRRQRRTGGRICLGHCVTPRATA